MSIYWLKLVQQIGVIVAVCLIVVFGFRYGAHPYEIVAAILPLLAALSLQLPAFPNFKTTFPTKRPPPLPATEQPKENETP